MKRRFLGFSEEDEGDWRAKLECGCFLPVLHEPPLITRKWVLSNEGRNGKLGAQIKCKKCNEDTPKDF